MANIRSVIRSTYVSTTAINSMLVLIDNINRIFDLANINELGAGVEKPQNEPIPNLSLL